MRFFLIAFALLTAVCGYFWYADAPGSGMAYPTCIFAAILVATLIYTKAKTGSFFSDSAAGK